MITWIRRLTEFQKGLLGLLAVMTLLNIIGIISLIFSLSVNYIVVILMLDILLLMGVCAEIGFRAFLGIMLRRGKKSEDMKAYPDRSPYETLRSSS